MWKGFQRPQRVEIESESLTPSYGKFIAQPFERGFGTTIGNAMRRCLLSSIEGAAVTAVQIEGVQHEFSALQGVKEDVTDIILNLKQLPIRLHGDAPRFLTVDVKGPAEVNAGDFATDPNVEVVDADVPIATINEDAHLKMQARVAHGRGYVSAEKNFDESMGIGWIPIDSVHSPVKRVNYRVEAARLGRATDYERLILEVWTNGTVSPEEAVSLAAQLLQQHLGIFLVTERVAGSTEEAPKNELDPETEQVLNKDIESLGLSVRSNNTLKNANIHTIRDLVNRSERDMLEAKGFGRKSLEELQEALDKYGLRLGMNAPETAGTSA